MAFKSNARWKLNFWMDQLDGDQVERETDLQELFCTCQVLFRPVQKMTKAGMERSVLRLAFTKANGVLYFHE